MDTRNDSTPTLVDEARSKAKALLNPMCDNTTPMDQLTVKIQEFNQHYLFILASHRTKLTELRNEMLKKNTGDTTYIKLNIDSSSPVAKLNEAIKTVNELLNPDENKLKLIHKHIDTHDPDSQEINDIQFYLSCKEIFDNYALRIKIFLCTIKLEINKIEWKEKSIFGSRASIPQPVQQMKNILVLSNDSTFNDILETYSAFLELFKALSKLENPHASTTKFCRDTTNIMNQSLTFLAPDSKDQKKDGETTNLKQTSNSPVDSNIENNITPQVSQLSLLASQTKMPSPSSNSNKEIKKNDTSTTIVKLF